MDSEAHETEQNAQELGSVESPVKTNGNMSQSMFPESPVYEPDDDVIDITEKDEISTSIIDESKEEIVPEIKGNNPTPQSKRKLSDEVGDSIAKIKKLDIQDNELTVTTQNLDDEVSEIITTANKHIENVFPTSRVRTPVRSSPRTVKRSNSVEITKPKTPGTPKSRPASVDLTKERKTPRKRQASENTEDVPRSSRPSVEFVKEIPPKTPRKQKASEKTEDVPRSSRPSVEFVKEIPPKKLPETIAEESGSELNDSQNFHLVLSPTDDAKPISNNYSSDPVLVKDRQETISPVKVNKTRSEGFNYSDQSNLSQPKLIGFNKGKTTDQESTDSVESPPSPDHKPSVASKMISKLSNGNSSTPTELAAGKRSEDNDSTPDMMMLTNNLCKRGKNESFRASNTTTPSTISPFQNGHGLSESHPQPIFDVIVNYNEDGEFMSLYVVKTDSDLGLDMCKEYQRFSKRFTIDPYLGDVSVSTSPSSVTSTGMINLPNRTSFASTVSSSSSSSNRTSDGAFVVPQPPRKSIINPVSTVRGFDVVIKKVQDVLNHAKEAFDGYRSSSEDKISVAVQTSPHSESLSNGNLSPEESKCDKATPKSSLKKSRVRGRRNLATKTKRNILPTQPEEPEYMHGMNSPEMVPTNGDDKSLVKSPKSEKSLSLVATPKSVSKLKQKRRPTSPRPATPVEKSLLKSEYPGYAPGTAVLAKWVDKRYYSGRVLEITEPNKYLIKFDDGQSKVLLDDFIIFGDTKTLPLIGQSVYSMVDEEQNYEPGLVLGVEENDSGTITYRCTTDGDTMVMVTASELYLTEDQARSLKESARRSPAAPGTPRRRAHRELDLDNIIQGPRSARTRDKGSSSAKKRETSPKSPKASTSGVKTKSTPVSRRRLASESSESSNSAPPARLEEVAGVEPEVQRTPRKIDGVKAGPLHLKGAAKQNIGKKNSKLAKFSNDSDTVSALGPIPPAASALFAGLHFLLTCTEPPRRLRADKCQDTRHYSSEEDGETTAGTDCEDLEFCDRPFNKERLKEQLEAGGGIVYSHFDEVPRARYGAALLVAPRPCLTAKYILALAGGVRAVSHAWVILSCAAGRRLDEAAHALPAGWSLTRQLFVNWVPPSGKRNTQFFKDKLILLCGEQDTFVKFWERVCSLGGAGTRAVSEDDLNMAGALALVTEWDCPHVVQNKAHQDNVPLVSTTWVVQCLIEARALPPTGHDKFSFMYTEPE